MKLKNITVWLFLFAGVLYTIAGLRDIFAPGFFNISPRVPTRDDIAMQFVLAGVFLAMAAFTKTQNQARPNKK
ncbi:MAG TPA: hypothetical protein VGW76_10550 [Pyrinomonadaceae bacterium]|nr:hypothetical protein [Pyrinomonadaceae bacterium]